MKGSWQRAQSKVLSGTVGREHREMAFAIETEKDDLAEVASANANHEDHARRVVIR